MIAKEFNLEAYLEALKPLVNIDCGTNTPAGVARIADMMTEKYENIGWQVTREDFGEQVGPGLLVTNKPGAEQFDIMLIGHMDTVFPEGTVAEWSLTHDDEKAYGPGCADMKSGLLRKRSNRVQTPPNCPEALLTDFSQSALSNSGESAH